MPEKKLFWTTIPGILSGIALLITALTGLYLALHQVPQDTRTSGAPTTLAQTKTLSPSSWPLIEDKPFTNEDSGWIVGSFKMGRIQMPRCDIRVVDGIYRWDVKFTGNQSTFNPAPYVAAVNFKVAVDVKFTNFTNDMMSTLAFGVNGNERYIFYVSSKGFFGLFISNYPNKNTLLIDETPIPITSKFNPNKWNRMSVVVDEQLIRCYLNSHLLVEYRYDAFAGGKVGLGVGASTGQGGSAVLDFKNFEFRRKP